MPSKKQIKYQKSQWVEVGQGKGKKPLVGEILGVSAAWDYSRHMVSRHMVRRNGWSYRVYLRLVFERNSRTRIINYSIHFVGEQSPKWIDQEKILRAQPELTHEELEARARKLFGEDYL